MPPKASASNILVVDDYPIVQRWLCRVLSRKGRRVVAASSACEARRKLDAERFDLCLIDLLLETETAGRGLLRDIKNDPSKKHIPVIVMTGEAVLLDPLQQAMREGAADYLVKPFSMDLLHEKVDRLLVPEARARARTSRPSRRRPAARPS